jgi:DNA-binding transcriptional MerR regulator
VSKPAEGEMTIHGLAERTGMTVRNIRAHQTRGLLPPPIVRGRTGYYNEEHVARIELTRQLQADGLNLEAIRLVLAAGNGAATEIVDLTRSLRAPFEEEAPEIVDIGELASHWRAAVDAGRGLELLRRAEDLGVLRSLPDDKVEVISPRMLEAALALADLGFSADAVFTAAEKLRRKADDIAGIFTELFLEEVWEPFVGAGRPESDWPKVRQALDRTRPLGADVLMGAFQIAMAEATEEATERTIRSVVGDEGKPSGGERKPTRKRSRRRR